MKWIIFSIVFIAVALVNIFFKSIWQMKKIQSQIRASYLLDGLSDDEASKIAWYLVDVFIFLRNNKDPKLARVVMDSTMNIFRLGLHRDDTYENQFYAKMQVEAIQNSCLLYRDPIPKVANTMYDAVVASYKIQTGQK